MHNRQLFDRVVFSALAASLILWLASNFFVTVWYAKTPLVPNDRQQYDDFGVTTAIDGDTIVVGAPYHVVHRSREGTAYVFVHNGSSWIQQAKLVANEPLDRLDRFGEELSISGDTIAVASFLNSFVFIFTRQGTIWTQQGKLTRPAQSSTYFGKSVALDGDVLVVGDLGMAHVYRRDAATNTWSYQTTLTPAPVSRYSAQEGDAVAISNGVIVVKGSGRALVFARASDGVTWQQQAELVIPAGRKAGVCTVAISGDTIVIGACNEHVGLDVTSIGAAHVFERDSKTGNWSYRTRLTPRGVRRGEALDITKFFRPYGFGSGVAIDGDTIVVRAGNRSSLLPSQEVAAYLFQRTSRGSRWTQRAKIFSGAQLSSSTSTASVSGQTIVVGNGFGAFVLDIDTALSPQHMK
jgi:hypothetical protein